VIVVSDTTPLSELAKVGRMTLLRDIFGTIAIPQEVYQEVTTGIHPAVNEVKTATWIEVHSVFNSQKVADLRAVTQLHLGECAAIILAEELNAAQILIDERAARQVAESRNLKVIGTIGILLLAKNRNLISNVKELLDALMTEGMRISPTIYRKALKMARE
jgi:predicted nucleic acid-binding protein